MKSKILYAIPSLVAIAALTWTAIAGPPVQKEPETEAAAVLQRMDQKKALIIERLAMSAPMELENVDGVDLVEESRRLGFVAEVTLEEVEAALAAAAQTPSAEDDIQAIRLMHWGSYRFYPDEPTKASRTTPAEKN